MSIPWLCSTPLSIGKAKSYSCSTLQLVSRVALNAASRIEQVLTRISNEISVRGRFQNWTVHQMASENTVKLGYNEQKKMITYYISQPGYNEQNCSI